MTANHTPGEAPSKATSIYVHMLRGSAWAMATRWVVRVIGLVSTVILARLLTPEDFGVVATGALTIGFIQGFGELGVQQLLVRERNTSRNDYDTAWTVQLLQGIFVASVVVIGAPLAARYFGDDRAATVVRLLALSAILEGATNIGLVLARKELNFAIDFRFRLIMRVARFVVTISLALWLRSYWALVFGRLAASFFAVPLSFALHPYRPRLSLAHAGKYLRFGSAIVPGRIGRYLEAKADVAVVGGLAGSTMLGVYNVAADLSQMLTRELLTPIGAGLLPSYAKLSHEPARYAEAFRHVLGTSATVVFPAGFGLSVVAPHVVPLILGSQWLAAVPLVQILALYYTITALLHAMSEQVLIAGGHERRTAILVWVRLAVFVPAILIAGKLWGVEAVAGGAVAAAIIATPVTVFVLTKSIELTYSDVVAVVWRPLFAALVMAFAVRTISSAIDAGDFVSLLVDVLTGAVIYVVVLCLLWFLAGRPDGLERVAIAYAGRKLAWRTNANRDTE